LTREYAAALRRKTLTNQGPIRVNPFRSEKDKCLLREGQNKGDSNKGDSYARSDRQVQAIEPILTGTSIRHSTSGLTSSSVIFRWAMEAGIPSNYDAFSLRPSAEGKARRAGDL
jgi:hypothetical protein